MKISVSRSALGQISILIAIISCLLFALGIDKTNCVFWAFNLLWLSNLIYCLDCYSERYIFFTFNLTYFLFYMGRITLSYLLEGNYGLDFSAGVILNTCRIIFIGLFALRLFMTLFSGFSSNHGLMREREDSDSVECVNNLAWQFFWITYPFQLLVILERVIFVSASGYVDFYASYSSSLPSIVNKIGSVNEIMFFLFLGTLPSKERSKWPIIAFLFLGVLSLGYGQRNPLAVRFMFIFLIYIPLRDAITIEGEERWITHKYKIFCGVAIPAIIVLMAFWKFFRQDMTFTGNLSDLILDFFDTEGNSAYIIALALDNIEGFSDKVIYSLEPIYEFITNNFIYKALFGAKSSELYQNTVYAAMNSWDIGKPLSYYANSTAYFNGVGTGTCYLVEVFVDFGYVGIFLISAIYCWIINYIQKGNSQNWMGYSIGLLAIYEIIYSPRDLALSFVSKFFSFTFLAVALVMWWMYKRRIGAISINK